MRSIYRVQEIAVIFYISVLLSNYDCESVIIIIPLLSLVGTSPSQTTQAPACLVPTRLSCTIGWYFVFCILYFYFFKV